MFRKGGFNQGDENGQGSQNPFKKDNGSSPPEPPDNSDGGVPFQQRPDGNNAPPQKPDGDFPGDMPGGQNGKPPEKPDGDTQERPEMPYENMQGEMKKPDVEQVTGEKEQPDSPPNQPQKPNEPSPEENADRQNNNSSDKTAWILTAVSIIVLAVGLFVAQKKKY